MRTILLSAVALMLAGAVSAQPLPGTPAGQPEGASATGSCATCGVVESVRYVEKKGEGSGAGLVAGGIVGGVLGHQIGSGRGNTAATILGAGAGAYAGNRMSRRSVRLNWRDETGTASDALSSARNSRALRARRNSGVPITTPPRKSRTEMSRTSESTC